MEVCSSGIHIITAIGCSLILFAMFRSARTDSTDISREKEAMASPIKPSVSSRSEKKKVRFSEPVAKPSDSNADYRKRSVARRVGEMKREKGLVGMQANRSVLYRGMYRYRLQMSTSMIYG